LAPRYHHPGQRFFTVPDVGSGMPDDCPFCQIVAGEQSAHRVLETDDTLAFLDINAVAEGHTLVVPRAHVESLLAADTDTTTSVFESARRVGTALDETLDPDGINLFQSTGEAAGQDVFHFHVHVIPRWADDEIHFAPARERIDPEHGAAVASRLREAL
jgi:histidine triad (HIT) family protein